MSGQAYYRGAKKENNESSESANEANSGSTRATSQAATTVDVNWRDVDVRFKCDRGVENPFLGCHLFPFHCHFP